MEVVISSSGGNGIVGHMAGSYIFAVAHCTKNREYMPKDFAFWANRERSEGRAFKINRIAENMKSLVVGCFKVSQYWNAEASMRDDSAPKQAD
ncbi:hypothetical protein [Brevibacterium zhoupengii]|uniref:hypothetical protein n=1 Tax=Brevibacterium zhoupengii TaxID=2898795 RepID=UPI001E3C0312|nr:hypothetical protein [Brevibacterium zhoupengii]